MDTTGAPEGTTVTVDNPGNLPTGDVPGTVNVPVTVTYPDGTEDHITVPVTTGEKPVADNVTNEPTVTPVENHMAKQQQQMTSKEQSIQQVLQKVQQ